MVFPTVIPHDADLTPENCGGPLFDLEEEVCGFEYRKEQPREELRDTRVERKNSSRTRIDRYNRSGPFFRTQQSLKVRNKLVEETEAPIMLDGGCFLSSFSSSAHVFWIQLPAGQCDFCCWWYPSLYFRRLFSAKISPRNR